MGAPRVPHVSTQSTPDVQRERQVAVELGLEELGRHGRRRQRQRHAAAADVREDRQHRRLLQVGMAKRERRLSGSGG